MSLFFVNDETIFSFLLLTRPYMETTIVVGDNPVSAFKVTPKKYAAASTVISVRVPKDMAQALDTLADETGRTRNELIVMALEFALDNLEITKE